VGLVNALPENEAGVRAFDPRTNAPARSVLHPSAGIVDTAEETAWGVPALFLLTKWEEIVGADWAGIAGEMRFPKFLDGRKALDADLMSRLGFEDTGVGRGNVNSSSILRRAGPGRVRNRMGWRATPVPGRREKRRTTTWLEGKGWAAPAECGIRWCPGYWGGC
jgi:hypothetical protein